MTSNEHYEIKYDGEGNIIAMYCNHCDRFSVGRREVGRTRTGHRWPFMVHRMKAHIRDEHGINLYKRS